MQLSEPEPPKPSTLCPPAVLGLLTPGSQVEATDSLPVHLGLELGKNGLPLGARLPTSLPSLGFPWGPTSCMLFPPCVPSEQSNPPGPAAFLPDAQHLALQLLGCTRGRTSAPSVLVPGKTLNF